MPGTPEPDDWLGPIDFLAVEFPGGVVDGDGFDQLLDLVDRQVIGVLDVQFVAKEADGRVAAVGPDRRRRAEGGDLGLWAGASSGLLDDDDIAEVGGRLSPGGVAVVVVYENRWMLGLVRAWTDAGARFVTDGGVLVDDLLDSLDALEPA